MIHRITPSDTNWLLIGLALCAQACGSHTAKPAATPTQAEAESTALDQLLAAPSNGSEVCPAAPAFADAKVIAEQGLCGTPAEFLGKPVCADWHAFLSGAAPQLPSRTFAVGATFRVEQARTGAIAWSEMNPMFALYNAGDTRELSQIHLLDISPDNDAEVKEGAEYLAAAFQKRRNARSSLQAYIEERITTTPTLAVRASADGHVSDLGCAGQLYIRQSGERMYALLAGTHDNAWDYDSHPVLYFMILAPP